MLEKRADFVIGKSYTDDGSGVKAKTPPTKINEILTENDDKFPKVFPTSSHGIPKGEKTPSK